jgi:hypothetical protein
MVAWLVTVPAAFIYIVGGFIMEALFAIGLRRSDDSHGTDSAG